MRKLMVAGLVLLAGACAEQAEKAAPTAAVSASLQRPGCYTVDLFTEVKINDPAPEVAPEVAAFLGDWGNGVWNGEWCHELLIHTVHPDGRVEMLDMHAPTETYGSPATVFKRVGQVREDGALHFAHDVTTRRYELIDGRLHGVREGSLGTLAIIMTRKGVVPLPVPRPVRLARADPEGAGEGITSTE